MKIQVIFVLMFLIPRKLSGAEKPNLQLNKYLQKRSEILQEKCRAIRQINEESDILGSYNLSDEFHDPNVNTFTFFNETFFIIDNEIFVGSLNGSLNMEFYGDFKYSLRTHFFKALQYQNTEFMALGIENEVSIYTFNKNQSSPSLMQMISAPNSSDAIFFLNGGSLYFVLSTNKGEHISILTFYKWLGSHFDEIETLHNTGMINKLGSFPYKLSEIIIAFKSLPEDNMKISSSVFEFNKDKVKKIQQLYTQKPTSMDIFFQKDIPYVLTYEKGRQQLFRWNGFEMVWLNMFHWKHNVDKSIVVYSNTTPLIVQPQLNQVSVFKPQNDEIHLYKTKSYRANYSIILDINRGENENSDTTFIVGLNDDNIINIHWMSFKAHVEMEREKDATLPNCFNNLEQQLYDRRYKLNQTNNRLVSTLRKRQTSLDPVVKETAIENKLEDIKSRLNKVRPVIKDHGNSSNQFVVKGKTVIKGNIVTKEVKAKKIAFETVNDKKWTPKQWLRYTQEQIISGAVKINNLSTKVLVANGHAALLFENLLRDNGNQKISGKFKIHNLHASKMTSKTINDIEVEQIYQKGDSTAIKGMKSFENVSAKKTNITKINGINPDKIFTSTEFKPHMKFAHHVTIDNIHLHEIDGINWVEFEKSVFKIGEDKVIKGNITAPQIKARNLQTKSLNGINPHQLLTKSTDQIINSTIEFNYIKASNIDCQTVNDIDINKSVRIDQNNTVIKGHVKIDEVDVINDLELKGNITKSFLLKEGDHVFGAKESDLLQRYLGKVTIKGNLYVDDFSTLLNTTIFLKGNEYSIDALKEYWNKHGNQSIPVHFEATNGLTASHLKTKSLNEVPIDQFAINDKKTEIKSPIFFENVTVERDIILENDDSFDLARLAAEGVRINGTKYKLKGKKVFKNTLNVKQLESSDSNNELSTANKTYKKIIIRGDLISNVTTNTINKINIKKFTENLVALHKAQNLTDIEMKTVFVEHLKVKQINGKKVADYVNELEKMLRTKQIEKVNVKGNVTMQQLEHLKAINGHAIEELFIEVKDISDIPEEADFIGDVKFLKPVKIGNLRAQSINGIYFPNITKRFLHKKSNQTISGIFTFKNLHMEHLYTKQINEKNIENLIDVTSKRPQQIASPKGVTFENIKLEKSVKAEEMIPCDIYKAIQKIRYPETQEWALVEISGNVTLLDENCDLNRILEKSVKKDQQNIISGQVKINGHVLAEKVEANSHLNGINLTELIEDVVLNDSEEEQIITGHKIFTNTIEANAINVLENADIPVVNNMLVSKLYSKIITRDQVNNITILGKKTFFGGLQADRILTKNIAGIKPENIISLSNLSQIPEALFDSIDITNNFNVKFINSYEVNYILNNRLFTNTFEKQFTRAVCFFSDLEIIDNLNTRAINKIDIDDVVFDVGNQKIVGSKRFMQDLSVFGNATVGYLNGVNVTEALNNEMNQVINGSITFLNPVKLVGNITTQTLNGYPIDQIKEIMRGTVTKAEENMIFNTSEMSYKVRDMIENALPKVKYMPNEFMYIERSEDLQIRIPNAIDASVTNIKDYTLIHILSEESHEKCNLPEGCKCPIQHTAEITPQLSVSYFLNKRQQRVYSYDDDTLTIHLITNSISTDSRCRTNQTEQSNEVSTMTWSTATRENVTGSFYVYPTFFTGYISGAQFFTLNTMTYAVIARYYDAVADTHELDCAVIRFDEEKKSALEIQKIPTQGVWTLYLLHTAQGVVIIIGNLAKQPYTEIHRFNEETEKFELLKRVAYGCTTAIGVVLVTDSLIILANKDAPLQVLKYNPLRDNYEFYQKFALDEPVLGMSVFYVGGFGISEAYLNVVTEDSYRIYSFQYIDGWKLESKGTIRGLNNLIPFELNEQLYLFAASTGDSSLLRVAKHGAGDT